MGKGPEDSIRTIVITGAESTGKTTLTNELAKYYNSSYVNEYARTYVEKLSRPYNYNDIEEIAKHQVRQIEIERLKAKKL